MGLDAITSCYSIFVQQEAVAGQLWQVKHLLGLALDEKLAQLVASDWNRIFTGLKHLWSRYSLRTKDDRSTQVVEWSSEWRVPRCDLTSGLVKITTFKISSNSILKRLHH